MQTHAAHNLISSLLVSFNKSGLAGTVFEQWTSTDRLRRCICTISQILSSQPWPLGHFGLYIFFHRCSSVCIAVGVCLAPASHQLSKKAAFQNTERDIVSWNSALPFLLISDTTAKYDPAKMDLHRYFLCILCTCTHAGRHVYTYTHTHTQAYTDVHLPHRHTDSPSVTQYY